MNVKLNYYSINSILLLVHSVFEAYIAINLQTYIQLLQYTSCNICNRQLTAPNFDSELYGTTSRFSFLYRRCKEKLRMVRKNA